MLRIHSIHAPPRPKPSCLDFRPLPVFRRHLGLPPKMNQTNASGRPTPVFFFRSQSPLNPFEALSNYLSFRKLQSSTSTEPLFISESGHVATCFWFHHHLHQVLSLSGSFRIGASTSASRNGVPEHLIQILGCWSSQAYHRYIRFDLKDLRSAQSILL